MADNKNEHYQQLPTAPNMGQQFPLDPSLYHRPPPPTYEESQRWNPQQQQQQPMYVQQGGNFYPSMPGNVSGNPPPYQQPMQYAQQQLQLHQQGMSGYNMPNQPQYQFNYGSPQQQQQQMPISGMQMSPQQQIANGMASVNINQQYPTVTFDAGARFSGGSINIPPPPPGCAPTPEQLAALQGQPVILKKKKNSFF